MSSSSVSLGDSLTLSPGSDFEQTPPRIQAQQEPHRRSWSPHPTASIDEAGSSDDSRPAQPPRLPSPRLFRDFFSAMNDTASRRQATLPPANYAQSVSDVSRALRSANRALQNAQDAFLARRSRPERQSVVDLTSSSPPTNTAALLRLWPIRPQNADYFLRIPPDVRQQQDEEDAIHRQRENHSNWQRTQARTRERERTQANKIEASMSPPASSSTSQATSRPRSTVQIAEDPAIESVDLTEVDDNEALSAALAKQRQDAILAQNPGTESGRTTLTAYKCPVCMDTPTDATSTVCGHVFCHHCIIDTLKWSIEARGEELPQTRKVKGVCPVCRKQLELKDAGPGRHLIPLELKLMVAPKRKRPQEKEADTGKGKQKLVNAEPLSDSDEDEHLDRKRVKESIRAGKARKRESTDEALWAEFIREG